MGLWRVTERVLHSARCTFSQVVACTALTEVAAPGKRGQRPGRREGKRRKLQTNEKVRDAFGWSAATVCSAPDLGRIPCFSSSGCRPRSGYGAQEDGVLVYIHRDSTL